jgi:REP element-mobilizing transposase RayT
LAYLLTFSTYGSHLPGSDKGWVDIQHCLPGSPVRPHNPSLEAYWRSRLNESRWVLDREARLLTLEVILTVCTHRRWQAHAVHVRTTHVHAVIGGEGKPERMLSDFKAYATRAFRSAIGVPERRRFWNDHGSTRYLWKEASLKAAIDYVVNGQGVRMACHLDEPVNAGAPDWGR